LRKGVSPMDLPAYFVSIGFGSKLSMWLTPPRMKSQITRFAFCGITGSPLGGCQPSSAFSIDATAMLPSPPRMSRRRKGVG
jgi:hypothetical protein